MEIWFIHLSDDAHISISQNLTLMTGFVLQGHIYVCVLYIFILYINILIYKHNIFFLNTCMCVYLYIHNTYAQYTHINKNIY